MSPEPPEDPPGSAADVLDVAVFEDLRDSLTDRPDALAAVYREFLANATRFVAALRHEQGPARTNTLHTFKGSAAMVGANRIARLAARLQEQFPHSPGEAAAAIERLEAELAAFRQAIAAHVASLGDAAER